MVMDRSKSIEFLNQRKKERKKNNHTFSCSLEKELDYKNLQSSHTHHQPALDHAEIENAALGAFDRAEIAVFACSEIFLHAVNGR